jgi:hypothetical protein
MSRVSMSMTTEPCNHAQAATKMRQASQLLYEAYELWPAADIRRSLDRLYEALDDLQC